MSVKTKGFNINGNKIATVTYACYNINRNERAESSSGGIFILLAKYILLQSGVVFGAAYRSDFSVFHRKVNSENSLNTLLGSKYVQSDIGDTFQEVKKELKSGKKVLFSGTPCQVFGLRAFLKEDYEELICIDFICHGVPSPLIWQYYLKSISRKEKIRNINMRNKKFGWRNFSLRIQFEKSEIFISQSEDYMKGFSNNLYLRPSCYNCSFKGIQRNSELTLGDFWGVWDVMPELDDNIGTSIVLIHTQKGNEIFEKIRYNLITKNTNLSEVIKYNPCMESSVKIPARREEFFRRIKNGEEFNSIVNNLITVSLYTKIKKIVKEFIVEKYKIKNLDKFS